MELMRKVLITGVLLVVAGAASASSDVMRGIYVNGQVHVFCNGCDNQSVIRHRVGTPDSNWIWQVESSVEIPSPVPPDYTFQVGQGLTIMNDTIYYFPLGDPGSSTSNDRYLACVQFDLTSNTFVTSRTKTLSKIHQSGYANAGSAAVTYSPPDGSQSVVYAFCDAATWSTGDGVNWASHPALVGSSYQPMDAVVFYPPDSDPQILIVYNKVDGEYLDFGLYAAIWNGKFGSASSLSWVQLDSANTHSWCNAALFLGTAAAASPFHAGQKAKPAVQVFANRPNGGGVYRWEYAYDAAGGAWSGPDSGVWAPSYYHLYVFPWYPVECDTAGDYWIQRQHLVLNAIEDRAEGGESGSSHAVNVVSDAMIPINKSGQHITCNTSWGGTSTDTGASTSDPDELATWEKYWSLLGVILGSPPFALNGWEGFELEPFSNIEVGAESSTDVSYSEKRDRTLTFSSGLTVTEGLEKLGAEFKNEIDVGYKYGWESGHESSQSFTTHFGKTFGTENANVDDPESLGRFGWAIFNIPKMLVQDYAIYAYDFNVNGPHPQRPGDPTDPNQNGTYLNQDLHSVEVMPNSSVVQPKAFLLATPGSDEDDVPGLMAGMATFSDSQDLNFWDDPGYAWGDTETSPWEVLLGDQEDLGAPGAGEYHITPLTFASDSGSSTSFTEELTQVDTSGTTTSVEIQDTFTVSEKCFLGGFKLNLSAGYDSQFSQEVTDTTSWSQNVEATLGMKTAKDPSDPNAVKTLTAQPYLLRATDGTAPWIPDQYRDQRPWCIAWQTQHEHYAEAGASRTCPVPRDVSGRSVGGDGGTGDAPGPKHGEFTVNEACMYFENPGRGEGATPVGADDFDPALGATVRVNGYTYATSQAKGKWTRQGEVWKYKTKESAKPQVLLKLDFGGGTWDLQISKVDLEGWYQPSRANIRLALVVNGRDSFYTAFTPQVKTQWDLKVPEASGEGVQLVRYTGEYDSALGRGSATLKGEFPKDVASWGDMAFAVNGREISAPLTSLKEFDQAVAKGKELVYDGDGLHLTVDFGKGKWKAKLKEGGFDPLFAPRRGSARIRVSVGGVGVYSQEHGIADHTTKFSFAR